MDAGDLPGPVMGRTPHFSFVLPKEKRAVHGPKRKTLCRAPVQWPSARTGISRIGAGKTCRPSAGSRRSAHFPRPRPACPAGRSSGRKIEWPLLLNPLPLDGRSMESLQRANVGVGPYGRISGRTFCRGGCPHPPVSSAKDQPAPSGAEGAEIEERQMRFCTPGLCRHPAAGTGEQA